MFKSEKKLSERNEHLLPFNGRPRSFSGCEDMLNLFDQNRIDTQSRTGSKESLNSFNRVIDSHSRSPSPHSQVRRRRGKMNSSASPLSQKTTSELQKKQRRKSMSDFPLALEGPMNPDLELSLSRASLRSDPSTGQPIEEEDEDLDDGPAINEKAIGIVDVVNGKYVSSGKTEPSDSPSLHDGEESHDTQPEYVLKEGPETSKLSSQLDDNSSLLQSVAAQITPEEESFPSTYSAVRPIATKSNDKGVFVLATSSVPSLIICDDCVDIVIGSISKSSALPCKELEKSTSLSDHVMVIP